MTDLQAESSTSRIQRQEQIASYVLQQSSVSVKALADRFNVSAMTIHRDLDELEAQGILRKVRGGATAQPSSLFESDTRYRLTLAVREKEAIAQCALAHIEPGQAVMVDDSTTVLALVKLFPQVTPLTVITYGLAAVRELGQVRGIQLISAGGEYLPKYDAFVGLLCEQAIATLRANVLFMSVAAVSGNYIFQPEEEFVKLKRVMLASAEKRILLIDHTKLDKIALHRLASLQEFDHIIIDSGVDDTQLKALKGCRVPIEIAPLL